MADSARAGFRRADDFADRQFRDAFFRSQRAFSRRKIRAAVRAANLAVCFRRCFIRSAFCPEKRRLLFALNPMSGILEGFRAALFGGDFDWSLIGISFALTLVLMLVSLFVFKRMEDDFADLI